MGTVTQNCWDDTFLSSFSEIFPAAWTTTKQRSALRGGLHTSEPCTTWCFSRAGWQGLLPGSEWFAELLGENWCSVGLVENYELRGCPLDGPITICLSISAFKFVFLKFQALCKMRSTPKSPRKLKMPDLLRLSCVLSENCGSQGPFPLVSWCH